MIRRENDCVGCDIPCINCGLKHNPHRYCDECFEEVDRLYYYEGEELCIDCIANRLEEVVPDE